MRWVRSAAICAAFAASVRVATAWDAAVTPSPKAFTLPRAASV